MAKQFFKLTFPQERITEPFLHELGKKFNLVTNIFRANVTADAGWVLLQLDGTGENIAAAVAWAREKGVKVEETAQKAV
ncbi:MAG: NIL domain-containing protein [Chloroflexi bacterium]|nr:NIL domain-containing protein [Chloroflexota bacterium]